ncbi:MAG: FAD-dependent oxidoreductase [Myxococcota bacterium]
MTLTDAGWLVNQVRCRVGCPVGTNAGGYVSLIGEGKYEQAFRFARGPNPLASICGRICAHPCETNCRRGIHDQPVSIRALKRFLTERHGVESSLGLDAAEWRRLVEQPGRKADTPGRVAIVGSGPAGLACAHDLALLGHKAVIFEEAKVAGGMLRLGVPEYRLPRRILDREIDFIVSLGVELRLGVAIGRDVPFSQLGREFDAVFLAVGAKKSRSLAIPGHDLDGVLKGIDFLINVNLGYRVNLGRRIVVIGGGNVAFDVARSALRHGEGGAVAPHEGRSRPDIHDSLEAERAGDAYEPLAAAEPAGADVHEVLDVARAARFAGAHEVHVVCIEPRNAMLADSIEVAEATEEGIVIHNGLGPQRIVGEGGRATGVETMEVESIFDAAGRFNPTFRPGTERVFPCDGVILAIGQSIDLSFLAGDGEIEQGRGGTIRVDPTTLETSLPGVYAGGDAAFGPRIAIAAVADGRRAARSIHERLTRRRAEPQPQRIEIFHRRVYEPAHPEFDRIARVPVPVVSVDRRVGVTEVEAGYTEEQARTEALRCLRCFFNVVIDAGKCVLCGRCVEACPQRCLKMVSLGRLEADAETAAYVRSRGLPIGVLEGPGAAMVMDEELCIRCGNCVRACPADACTMLKLDLDPDLLKEAAA